MIEIEQTIIEIKDDIMNISDKLICDKWIESKTEIYTIIDKLKIIFQYIMNHSVDSNNEEMAKLKNDWQMVMDSTLKSIQMQDAVQLEDLFSYDIIQLLNKSMEMAGIENE